MTKLPKHVGENTAPLRNGVWELAGRRLKLDPYFSPCTKNYSKWIKDLKLWNY
jgi:hypothetical protein